jgi:hypothetical protein
MTYDQLIAACSVRRLDYTGLQAEIARGHDITSIVPLVRAAYHVAQGNADRPFEEWSSEGVTPGISYVYADLANMLSDALGVAEMLLRERAEYALRDRDDQLTREGRAVVRECAA